MCRSDDEGMNEGDLDENIHRKILPHVLKFIEKNLLPFISTILVHPEHIGTPIAEFYKIHATTSKT